MRKALYILGQLNDDDVQWLARNGTRRRLKPGQVIIEEGKPVDGLFVTLDGTLSVCLNKSTEVAQLGAGELVGEIAFVDSAPPSATVRALRESSVLEIKRPLLQRKLAEDSEFAARFYRALAVFLADRLRATTRRLGYGKAGDLDSDAVLEDELEGAVLDTVSQAGERFRRLLGMLAGRPEA